MDPAMIQNRPVATVGRDGKPFVMLKIHAQAALVGFMALACSGEVIDGYNANEDSPAAETEEIDASGEAMGGSGGASPSAECSADPKEGSCRENETRYACPDGESEAVAECRYVSVWCSVDDENGECSLIAEFWCCED